MPDSVARDFSRESHSTTMSEGISRALQFTSLEERMPAAVPIYLNRTILMQGSH